MNVVDAAAIGLCEQIEGRMGARAALAVFKPLIHRVTGGGARVRAILGALRCAVNLGDADEIAALTEWWAKAPRQDRFGDVVALTISLTGRGLTKAAAQLAVAEAERDPRARAHYLAARCLEAAGDSAAVAAFARAAEKAALEGEGAIAVASRARRIERLAAEPATRALGLAEAMACDPSEGSPAERLVIARVRLDAPSPFARATALSMLEELARSASNLRDEGDAERQRVAAAAIHLAAAHADELGADASSVELERIAATLRHWPHAAERAQALARLDALAAIARAPLAEREPAIARAAALTPETEAHLIRARAVVAGAGQGAFPKSPRAPGAPAGRLADHALDAIASEAHGRPSDAAAALSAARELLETPGVAPPALWTAVRLCAASHDDWLGAEAARLGEVLLSRRGPAPPRGYGSLARPFEAAGRGDLATRALRAAGRAREAGALDELAASLAREGYRLAQEGEREAAVERFREAREAMMPIIGR